LVGVLQGQEMIENSRVKAGANDMKGISVAFNAYLDRFQRTPGDDGPVATLTARGTNWTNVQAAPAGATAQNGILNVTAAQTFTGAGEAAAFWSQLKAAGFIKGDPIDAAVNALPRNAFGGLIGVTPAVAAGSNIAMQGTKVCLSQVPGKAAAGLDAQLDDGNPSTGSVRASVAAVGANTAPGAATPAAGTPYSEDNQYTISRTL
jgi:hypothetical protein